MRIAIIGGGTGGMTVASSLLDTAIDDVGIYESATAVKELGVGINILPHAVREMRELGLLDALYGVGIPTAKHVFYSSSTTSSCQLIAA
jgi:5-methylphenazine-1-carboxylate 1-monooxygenase